MTDARFRQCTRQDPRSVEGLTERLRAGLLTRELVELAAYCGDEASLIVSPIWCPDKFACDHGVHGCIYCDPPFSFWRTGLSRYATPTTVAGEGIRDAARLAGEHPVRTAIQAELIDWALKYE